MKVRIVEHKYSNNVAMYRIQIRSWFGWERLAERFAFIDRVVYDEFFSLDDALSYFEMNKGWICPGPVIKQVVWRGEQ